MDTPIPRYLGSILETVQDDCPDDTDAPFGAAVCTTGGFLYSAGDDEAEFTIQSVSKPFVFAIAVAESGIEKVVEAVGMEPSGEAFDEMSLGERNQPKNPMINAGALAVNQLILGEDAAVRDRVEHIRKALSRLAGRELSIAEDKAAEEMQHADRNLSLAHMLRSYGIIHDDAEDAVWGYTLQCSIQVTVRDLAVMAATLTNRGIQPVTGERIFDDRVCRLTLALMATTGMYDASGRWMARVGIPAKSGVSGGLIGVLPGELAIATVAPGLDSYGNSVRGVRVFEALSDDMGMHLMSGASGDDNLIRRFDDSDKGTVIQLQGPVDFTGAAAVLRSLADVSGDVVLDLTKATGAQSLCSDMLRTGIGECEEAGHAVRIDDPEGYLSDDGDYGKDPLIPTLHDV